MKRPRPKGYRSPSMRTVKTKTGTKRVRVGGSTPKRKTAKK